MRIRFDLIDWGSNPKYFPVDMIKCAKATIYMIHCAGIVANDMSIQVSLNGTKRLDWLLGKDLPIFSMTGSCTRRSIVENGPTTSVSNKNRRAARLQLQELRKWAKQECYDKDKPEWTEGWAMLEKLVMLLRAIWRLSKSCSAQELEHTFSSAQDQNRCNSWAGLRSNSYQGNWSRIHKAACTFMYMAFEAFCEQDLERLEYLLSGIRDTWKDFNETKTGDAAMAISGILEEPLKELADRGDIAQAMTMFDKKTLKWPALPELDSAVPSASSALVDGVYHQYVEGGREKLRLIGLKVSDRNTWSRYRH